MSRPAEIEEIDLASLAELEAHGPARRVVVHMFSGITPWRYTLKNGEEAAYTRLGGGMAVHRSHPEKLRLVPLCTELTGVAEIPYRDGNTENRASRNVKLVTCVECRVALDRALEQGRVKEVKAEWSGKFRGTIDVALPTQPEAA